MQSRNKILCRVKALVVCAFFCLVPLFVTGATAAEKSDAVYPELPLQEMRVISYTKAFAERLGLPTLAPGTEPSNGLNAIEFAIEKGPSWAPYYYCNFYLYVDDSLPIKFPEEGGAGMKYMFVRGTHFFGQTQEMWLNWPKEDRLYFSDRQGEYRRKARLATQDYVPGKQGAISDLGYDEYHKAILPSIAYLKLDFPPSSTMVEQADMDISIWLQLENSAEYRHQLKNNPDDFIKFKVPDSIARQIKVWGMQAREANKGINKILKK